MSKTRTLRYALIVFLLLPLITFAETQKIKEYEVIKGDCLWNISKAELNDPFMWPKIWEENKWIANPHLIYPDQIIKIPLYLIQVEKREEEAAPKPAATSQETPVIKKEAVMHPLVQRSLLLASGYIADKIPGVDTLWDGIQTFIRIPAGAALAAGVFGGLDSAAWTTVAAILGGSLAATSHFTKAGTRAAANTSPEPFSNVALSVAEDVAVGGLLWLVMTYPWVAAAIVGLLVLLALWLLPKLFGFIRRILKALFGTEGPEPGR